MNETIEDGDGLYHKKVPMLICMPIDVYKRQVLETGNIVLSGDAKEMMNNDSIKKAYLGE